MGSKELSQALGELSSILQTASRARGVPVLAVDAAVHTVKRALQLSDVELMGGGGTNMGVGVEAASRLRPRPDVIVVLTDGLTPWPTHPPKGSRVVVGLLGNGGEAPPWAKAVRISVKD